MFQNKQKCYVLNKKGPFGFTMRKDKNIGLRQAHELFLEDMSSMRLG